MTEAEHSPLRAYAEEAHAPTIVLVPGLDGTALLFYRQIPLLAQRFNVVAFPLPERSVGGMDDLVEDLRLLIEDTAPSEVVLCGESFGGALSLSFALAHPGHVRGLVLVNSFSVLHMPWRLRWAPRLLRALPWGAMPVVRRFTESRLHSPHVLPEDLREFHERAKQIRRDGYIRRLQILRDYDVRERLGEIQVPTLFLAGELDRLIPSVAEARFMSGRVPNASMHVLSGYGHCCLINHDLNLLDYVGPWFDKLAGEES
jgi:pimeloyl-ACP methyl ester carboxylesterase